VSRGECNAPLSGVAFVTRQKPRNLAASVRQRLFNLAQERHEDFDFPPLQAVHGSRNFALIWPKRRPLVSRELATRPRAAHLARRSHADAGLPICCWTCRRSSFGCAILSNVSMRQVTMEARSSVSRISHDEMAAPIRNRNCRPAITMIIHKAAPNVFSQIG